MISISVHLEWTYVSVMLIIVCINVFQPQALTHRFQIIAVQQKPIYQQKIKIRYADLNYDQIK